MKKKGLLLGGIIIGGMAALGFMTYENYIAYKKAEVKNKRLESYYNILGQWVRCKQNSLVLEKLQDYKDKNVAIYGMGVLGELLYNEIKKTDLKFVGFVDKNADVLVEGIEGTRMMSIDDISENGVDVVIVTPTFAFDDISKDIREKNEGTIDIVSLDEILG